MAQHTNRTGIRVKCVLVKIRRSGATVSVNPWLAGHGRNKLISWHRMTGVASKTDLDTRK